MQRVGPLHRPPASRPRATPSRMRSHSGLPAGLPTACLPQLEVRVRNVIGGSSMKTRMLTAALLPLAVGT